MTAKADYTTLIPNNVDLGDDKTLQRALERWRPAFLSWWGELGPSLHQDKEAYLRTATSVDAKGWATFGYVKTPDYRWGIFLADKRGERKIGFGDFKGKDVWERPPGEFRAPLRRLIVTQGDTEPASVEQQRMLGATCPSLYDLRNLFQVNVEEGRHLWAMAYLLHGYFGRDGREEATDLLERHSGDADRPRILGTFNEPIDDWASFFMFTYFTDRDGKFQLQSLAESAFDPLSRTCRFMLTEEAHHMFVGETGISRMTQRALEVMKELGSEDGQAVRAAGAFDLGLLQRNMNFWFSSSLDLFGAERSSNAAMYFANGLKGRPGEETLTDDHICAEGVVELEGPGGKEEVPTRSAMNLATRRAYEADCALGLRRWNRMIEKAGYEFRYELPSARFNRRVGIWSGVKTDPRGRVLSEEEWTRRRGDFLPTREDKDFMRSLMVGVTEPGKTAGWISPPMRGIDSKPWDYEYVRL